MKSFLFIASALISSIVAAPQPSEQPQLQRRLLDGLFGGNGIAAVDNGGHRTLSPESDSFKFTYDAGFGNWHGPNYVPPYAGLFPGPLPGPGPYPSPGPYPGPGPLPGPGPYLGPGPYPVLGGGPYPNGGIGPNPNQPPFQGGFQPPFQPPFQGGFQPPLQGQGIPGGPDPLGRPPQGQTPQGQNPQGQFPGQQ